MRFNAMSTTSMALTNTNQAYRGMDMHTLTLFGGSKMVTETLEFACIAEGVAHFFRLGFETVDGATSDGRIMHSRTQEVWIRKRGLLDTVATVIAR